MKDKSGEYGYNVKISSHCDESYHDGEQYGSWHSHSTNTFEELTKCDEKDAYPDVTSIHDFKIGDVAFLVWAEWSTGDSFGHGTNSSSEAFALLKNAEDAFKLAQALREATGNQKAKKWEDQYRFDWKSSDGQKVSSGFLPWLGYFENLENVYVETIQVGQFKRRKF